MWTLKENVQEGVILLADIMKRYFECFMKQVFMLKTH